MNQRGTRLLSLVLCLMMLLSLLPASAFAEDGVADAAEQTETLSLPEPVGDGVLDVPQDTAEPDEDPVGDGLLDVPQEPADPNEDPVEDGAPDVPQEPADPNEDNVGDGVLDVPQDTAEPNEDDVGDGVLDVPQDTAEPNEDDTPAELPVRVVFVCEPAELTLTVYPAATEAEPEPEAIEPEEDGSYLLLPGDYTYTATAEGYVSAEDVDFTVEPSEETVEIAVALILNESVSEIIETEEIIIGRYSDSRYNVINSNGITGKAIVEKAASYEGVPFTYSDNLKERTGFGSKVCFDCSGFVSRVCRDLGLTSDTANYNEGQDSNGKYYITAHTWYQKNYGTNLQSAVDTYKNTGSYSQFQPGDLLFYDYDGDGITNHVEIYAGNGENWGATESHGINKHSFKCGDWYQSRSLDSYLYAACRLVANSSASTSYLDKCTPYSSWLTVEVAKSDVWLFSLPCSGKTNPDSHTVVNSALPVGTKLEVTAMYKNTVTTSNNYWYKAKITSGSYSGKEGYIFAGDVNITSYKSNITYSGKALPTQVTARTSYDVNWTIKSDYLKIDTVSAYIGAGNNYSTKNYPIDDPGINATSYSLTGKIDNALRFDLLDPGQYLLSVHVKAVNNYSPDGHTIKTKTVEADPIHQEFTAVAKGHTHSYTTKVVAPTCTAQGYTLHTCSGCGNSYKDTYTAAKGHSYVDTVTKAATCAEKGVLTHKCSVCGDSYTTEIAALGHKYESKTVPGSCTERASVIYTCKVCGDSYAETAAAEWSEKTTEKPAGIDEKYIRAITEYRYSNYETTTSTASSLNGWTQIGSEKVWGDYGAWSGWSTTAVSASDSTQVEKRTAYGWYYFECPNCHKHMHGYGTCWTWAGGCGAKTTASGWHEMYDGTNWNVAKDWYGTGKYYATINGQTWFKWSEGGTQTQYRSRTRAQNTVYSYGRWTDWSAWSETAVSASSTRKVETRTVYQYDLIALNGHTWDNGVITTKPGCETEGIKTYTCTKCGETRTESVPATGHNWGAWKIKTKATVNADGVEERTCANCGETETRSYKAETVTVSFNGNGGSANQGSIKAVKGDSITLPSATREGYTFQGWATSSTATSAQYQPGGKYTANAAATLYAVWKQNETPAPVTGDGTLTVAKVSGSKGSEVLVSISADKNSGIMFLSFRLSYDSAKLRYLGGEDDGLTGWTFSPSGNGAAWDGDKDSAATGSLVKLRFQILDSASDGLVPIQLTDLFAANHSEQEVIFAVTNGSVTITSRVPGDVNGDGKVNGMDLIRLRKYLAGDSVEIIISNTDVTGDGKVNGMDLIRLRKYLAGDSVELK